MRSKITSKYQITIPRQIRKILNLHVADHLEWKIDKNKIIVEPSSKPFLKYKNYIKVGEGNIKDDIFRARKKMVEKHK
jgi:AbrB family looped-hinge helix DNA binding protein